MKRKNANKNRQREVHIEKLIYCVEILSKIDSRLEDARNHMHIEIAQLEAQQKSVSEEISDLKRKLR